MAATLQETLEKIALSRNGLEDISHLDVVLTRTRDEQAALKNLFVTNSFRADAPNAHLFSVLNALLPTLSALETLVMEGNSLEAADPQALLTFCQRLPQLPKLRHLTIRGNSISALPEEHQTAITTALASCQGLHSLNFSGNSLSGFPASFLAQLGNAIAQLPLLKKLELRSNMLGRQPQGLIEFMGKITQHKKLRVLDLSLNDISLKTTNLFRDSSASALEELNMSSNDIGTADQTAYSTFCKFLSHSPLTSLNLQNTLLCALDPNSLLRMDAQPPLPVLQTLATVLSKCTTLNSLLLDKNDLTPAQQHLFSNQTPPAMTPAYTNQQSSSLTPKTVAITTVTPPKPF